MDTEFNVITKLKLIIFLTPFLFVLLSLSITKTVLGQVVINEFSSWESTGDWVELYAYEDIDISGWILRDTAPSKVKAFPNGTVIGPSSSKYYVVEVGKRLNKDGDVIKLLKSDDTTIVDEISYGNQGGVCAPEQGQSVGRYPDANSTIERFRSLVNNNTKGATNDTATLEPCPSPTPEPTNTPTSTPKPTKAPTPTPTPRPTSTNAPKPKPTRKVVEDKKDTLVGTTTSEEYEKDENVLGIKEADSEATPTPEPDKETVKRKFPLLAGVFILSGISLVGFSIYPFLKNLKQKYNFKSEEPEDGFG